MRSCEIKLTAKKVGIDIAWLIAGIGVFAAAVASLAWIIERFPIVETCINYFMMAVVALLVITLISMVGLHIKNRYDESVAECRTPPLWNS